MNTGPDVTPLQTRTLQPDHWLDRYGDYLYSLAYRKVGNRETAEDIVQETFISAIKARDTFRAGSTEKTWLVAILKNKVIDYYRKKDPLRQISGYLAETDDSFSDHFFNRDDGHWRRETSPLSWHESADTPQRQEEFQTIVHQCVHKMPPALIPVFLAKFIDDEDSETICKDHNISSSNYWVIIHRAKLLIRSCLEKNWFMK